MHLWPNWMSTNVCALSSPEALFCPIHPCFGFLPTLLANPDFPSLLLCNACWLSTTQPNNNKRTTHQTL
jgi:hypothetical protein